MIRENGGWEMFRMIEVEKIPCKHKREAEKREAEVMKEIKANMNTHTSYITDADFKEYSKEYRKSYYELNKGNLQEIGRKYYEEKKQNKRTSKRVSRIK